MFSLTKKLLKEYKTYSCDVFDDYNIFKIIISPIFVLLFLIIDIIFIIPCLVQLADDIINS